MAMFFNRNMAILFFKKTYTYHHNTYEKPTIASLRSLPFTHLLRAKAVDSLKCLRHTYEQTDGIPYDHHLRNHDPNAGE